MEVAIFIEPDDAEEILKASGSEPVEALRAAWLTGNNEKLVIVDDDNKPYVAGGFTPDGIVWFVVTCDVKEFSLGEKLQLVRLLKEMRDKVLTKSPTLFNTVYKKNTQHLKLLEALGAEFNEIPTNSEFLWFSISKS
jgi:hypothetical protein